MLYELHKILRKAIVQTLFLLAIVFLINCLTGCASMTGKYHAWRNDIKQTADSTRYETRKQVENTCRAAIVSYESDKMTWNQYKDSENEEQRSWALAARLRANKAAIMYNEYILKNSYVFDGNIPADILDELPLIE